MKGKTFMEIDIGDDYTSTIKYFGKKQVCPECNNDKFELLDDLKFKCKKCGNVYIIDIQTNVEEDK